jgi:cytochrome c biogenesis protein
MNDDTLPTPAALRGRELARFLWRQLTSMRTALVLLFLLTLAALPGSLVPQRGVDPARVAQFKSQHETLGPIYERLSLFDVYSSPWFSAIYLLLFVSLIGCVLPRMAVHWTAARARPPAAPRHLDRLPASASWSTDEEPDVVLDRARAVLGETRHRVEVAQDSVAAERGHSRETGNLLFHVSLVLLLIAVAYGNLFGFKANVLVVEGNGFSNTITAYDTFTSGPAFDNGSLTPFTFTLDSLDVRYEEEGEQRGAPREFRAEVTYTDSPEADPESTVLKVNSPVVIDGTKIFLLGNGYAPVFTVRDDEGDTVFSGPVPFLPDDGNMGSTGVVKVPSADPQLGFEGFFLPTAAFDEKLGPVSVYPDLVLPRAVLTAFTGDLGLDDGAPQSVYTLDKSGMSQVTGEGGKPLARSLAPGATMELPDGASLTFDGVRRWASLSITHNPGTTPALVASVLALIGLMLSLFVRRRRVWVRAGRTEDGRTLVEAAALARNEGESRAALQEELDELVGRIRAETDADVRMPRDGVR